ncbi:MAG: hypothetical protein Kow0069_18910 [Promethearchaeota archaeon]
MKVVIVATFDSSFDDFVNWMSKPPGAMWFVFLLSLFISITSVVLTRWLVDVEGYKRQQQKIKEFQETKKRVEELKDVNPRKYAKEKRKIQHVEKAFEKMQQRMSLQRLKPTCVQFLPMVILFLVLRNTVFQNGPVAAPAMNPWDLPMIGGMIMATDGVQASWGWINFTGWYFLCSFSLNNIMQRTIGIPPQSGFGGFGGFDQQLQQRS